MALQGSLILNGADYAPFNLFGVGVFMAFSGQGFCRNNLSCMANAGDGPIPSGKYWIVDRQEGNWLSQNALNSKTRLIKYLGDVNSANPIGLRSIEMTGGLMMEPGSKMFIGDCFVCILGEFQKVVSPSLMIQTLQ